MAGQSQLQSLNTGMTLTERVYTSIKEAIFDRRLRPGSPWVEDELTRQLGTSKTPEAVMHVIAAHSWEGDKFKRRPESIIFHHAAFTDLI